MLKVVYASPPDRHFNTNQTCGKHSAMLQLLCNYCEFACVPQSINRSSFVQQSKSSFPTFEIAAKGLKRGLSQLRGSCYNLYVTACHRHPSRDEAYTANSVIKLNLQYSGSYNYVCVFYKRLCTLLGNNLIIIGLFAKLVSLIKSIISQAADWIRH